MSEPKEFIKLMGNGLQSTNRMLNPKAFPGLKVCQFDEHKRTIWLSLLEVESTQRSQGVGSSVLSFLKTKNKSIILEPIPDSLDEGPRLHRFYVKNGFRYSSDPTRMIWLP